MQDFQVRKIAWICENHEIDGFIVDFTRYGHFFNEDQADKFRHMNTYLRKLRAAIDKVNENKDRPVLLCASFGDRSWHLTHWGSGKLEDQGLDVQTWLKEDLFDYYPFAGHFISKRGGWNAEWTVQARHDSDGFSAEFLLPSKSLGASPEPGDLWRINVVVHNSALGEKGTTLSWSSPDAAFHLPRQSGTLFGTLVVE